jgi:hypothetical protein
LDKRDNRLAEGDGNANVYVIGDVMSQYGISFTDSAAQYCSIRKIQLGKRCLDQAAELCSFPPCERTSIACFSVRARRFCPAARLMKPLRTCALLAAFANPMGPIAKTALVARQLLICEDLHV